MHKAMVFDIKKQILRIRAMVESMLALSGMMRGSFGTTHHRCGRASCWCANPHAKGHVYTKLMWTDKTGPKTRSVRDEDIQTVLEAIEQDREFKVFRQGLKKEIKRLESFLVVYQRRTTEESRSIMGY